jgi:hypothetical protein
LPLCCGPLKPLATIVNSCFCCLAAPSRLLTSLQSWTADVTILSSASLDNVPFSSPLAILCFRSPHFVAVALRQSSLCSSFNSLRLFTRQSAGDSQLTMAACGLPFPIPWVCFQCGTDQNPCHCKVVGPTVGFGLTILLAVCCACLCIANSALI